MAKIHIIVWKGIPTFGDFDIKKVFFSTQNHTMAKWRGTFRNLCAHAVVIRQGKKCIFAF